MTSLLGGSTACGGGLCQFLAPIPASCAAKGCWNSHRARLARDSGAVAGCRGCPERLPARRVGVRPLERLAKRYPACPNPTRRLAPLPQGGPFDMVLAAVVLYERHMSALQNVLTRATPSTVTCSSPTVGATRHGSLSWRWRRRMEGGLYRVQGALAGRRAGRDCVPPAPASLALARNGEQPNGSRNCGCRLRIL